MASVLRIAILADAANAIRGLQQTGREAETAGKKAGGMGKVFGGLKGLLAGGLALGGIGALGDMFRDGYEGAREAAKITATLNAQLKNMAPSARAAFSDADSFASNFGNSIGKDDDDVRKVIAKLSTFPAAFGKGSDGADAMHRATKAAFDLEAMGIGSAEGNILGIGKALNDPIKGMTALSKSGVSFTAGQKDQIKNYMKQGKLADAQRVLLAGIETNAKGAATAAATPLDRLKATFGNIIEGMVGKLLPSIDKIATFLTTRVIPKAQELYDKFGPKLGQAVGVARTALGGLMGMLANPAVQAFAGAIAAVVISMKVYSVYQLVVTKATKAWAAVQAVLNVIMDANPIGIIVLAIVALVAGLVIAYKRSETFRKIVDKAFHAIGDIAASVFNWLKGFLAGTFAVFAAIFRGGVAAVKKIWQGLQWLWDKAKDIFNGIKKAINVVIGWVAGFIRTEIAGWQRIWAGVGWLWDKAKDIFNGIKSTINVVIGWVAGFIATEIAGWQRIFAGIMALWTMAKDLATKLFATFKSIPGLIVNALGNLGALLLSKGRELLSGMLSGVTSGWNAVSGWLGGIGSRVAGAVGSLAGKLVSRGREVLSGLYSGITSAWSTVYSWLTGIGGRVVSAIGSIKSKLLQIGKDAMAGIRDGLAAGWQWVADKVTALGRSLPGWLKKLLGIHSPSTVFRDLGMSTIEGFADGFATVSGRSLVGEFAADLRRQAPKLQAAVAALSPTIGATLNVAGDPIVAGALRPAPQPTQVTIAQYLHPTSDPVEVGRQTVKAIRAWEQTMGRTVLA